MKYGPLPTSVLEWLALASGRVPVPLIDAVLGPMKARAIMAAVSLGVFEAMRHGRHTAVGLASRLNLNAGALSLLLRILVLSEYLTVRNDLFALSKMARKTMLMGAPMQMVGYLRFNYAQWELIEHLEELVQTGHGGDFHQTMTELDRWRDYQLGMLEIARMESPGVSALIPVRRGAQSLLDVAGAHGLFGATICRRHPPMRCTVLDLPQAIPHASALVAHEGLSDVVSHRAGDALTSEFGHHDVLLLFNILHHFSVEDGAAIVRRAHRALRPDGTVAIWELEAPTEGSRASNGDWVAMFFRLTSTAAVYHGDSLMNLLQDAGFHHVRIVRPLFSPGKVLVTGRR